MSTLLVDAVETSGGRPFYTLRGSANFNGTGVITLRGALNVSSLTDIGAGQYGTNFLTAFADIGYSVNATHSNNDLATSFGYEGTVATSTTSARIGIYIAAFVDVPHVHVVLMR